ncbi:hypothetical protein ZIOFF_068187 [Zingiber officinale]|uniref:Uncharacterized protein n=1 Tax=Zingiber officinale TaxID=94328 RepID=A0A8J5C7V8_ZINOF|nr:hypothetical protein ZIOFF_068187 [Zingiber officinale]
MEVEEATRESSIALNIDLGEDEPLLHDSGVEDRVARQEVDSHAFSEVTKDARQRFMYIITSPDGSFVIKQASSYDNAGFMIDMLKECGLSHKSIIFVLDEFDLFAQISLLSQHVSKIELPPNTSAIKDLRILPNGLPLLASLGKKLLLYSMASNNLALKYELPWSRVRVVEPVSCNVKAVEASCTMHQASAPRLRKMAIV